jgi:hypothetical protein
MSEDFSAEELEQKDGYFQNAASSEFQATVARIKRQEKRSKLAWLRSLGRKGRLELRSKHGKRWQDAL